ncbi:MAG: right-handed parallel beta-helix repeat-containing protein [bacterium]|nr:right-handed parallel beta-helix repeat-containing protein [bacterium]
MTKRGILAFMVVLAAVPVAAVDGVYEINQVCMVSGCFPGDAPGFPVTISSPGSYRLTGNLTVPDADTVAIETAVDGVSLDLNGFALLGPTVCDPAPCTPTGPGHGVQAALSRITVTNGTVRGFGRYGVRVGRGSRVEGLWVSHNGNYGIHAFLAEIVVAHNVVSFNGTSGVECQGVVEGNVVNLNLGTGLVVGKAVVRDNLVKGNGSHGIFVDSAGCMFTGNTIVDNGLLGITFSSRGGYGGNVLTGNNGGDANPQVGGSEATEIGINLCGSDTVCP